MPLGEIPQKDGVFLLNFFQRHLMAHFAKGGEPSGIGKAGSTAAFHRGKPGFYLSTKFRILLTISCTSSSISALVNRNVIIPK
jgi:hypothetical protein